MLFPITDNVPFITNHVARTTCAVIDLRNSKDIPIETYAPFTYHSFVARFHPWRRDTAVKKRPSVSGLYGLYAVVFTRPRDLPTFFLSLSLCLFRMPGPIRLLSRRIFLRNIHRLNDRESRRSIRRGSSELVVDGRRGSNP